MNTIIKRIPNFYQVIKINKKNKLLSISYLISQSTNQIPSIVNNNINIYNFSSNSKNDGIKRINSSNSNGDNLSNDMDITSFHNESNEFFDKIIDQLGVIENTLDDDNIDINYSQGVLNINLGKMGTWVLNKQSPNMQIWWSSPLSGPKRFEYLYDKDDSGNNLINGHWICTKGKENLIALLQKELLEVTNIDILFEN
jgi:frataxin